MTTGWEGVDAVLARFGLPASEADREQILKMLNEQLQLEQDEEGDQFLMRLLCVQLFSIGRVEDSIAIWEAKSCCFDTMLGIDVQFLCGSGLQQTKEYLRAISTETALEALSYIEKCEAGGDFAGFSVEKGLEMARAFYKAS